MPYYRILEITKCISETIINQFEKFKSFIPGSSRKGIFTVIAKDNIDLNSSSSTATSHYHGTSMSILQFPTKDTPGIEYKYSFDMKEKVSTLKIVKLPERYSTVKTFISNVSEYSAPLCTICIPDFNFEKLRVAVNEEIEWLRSGVQNSHAWSSYHASKHRQSPREKDISTILPLIR